MITRRVRRSSVVTHGAMQDEDGRYEPFKDHFRWARVLRGDVPVYYLHGALHLVTTGIGGRTWKVRATGLQTVLTSSAA